MRLEAIENTSAPNAFLWFLPRLFESVLLVPCGRNLRSRNEDRCRDRDLPFYDTLSARSQGVQILSNYSL